MIFTFSFAPAALTGRGPWYRLPPGVGAAGLEIESDQCTTCVTESCPMRTSVAVL